MRNEFPLPFNAIINMLIAQDEGLASLSERELRKRVQRKLQIDDVDDLVKAENILVKKSRSGTDLTIKYEDRINIIGNLDAVVRFDKTARLGAP